MRTDLPAVARLLPSEGWRPFSLEFERAHRAMTAPGVTPVGGARRARAACRFARLRIDGEIPADLSLIAVHFRPAR